MWSPGSENFTRSATYFGGESRFEMAKLLIVNCLWSGTELVEVLAALR